LFLPEPLAHHIDIDGVEKTMEEPVKRVTFRKLEGESGALPSEGRHV